VQAKITRPSAPFSLTYHAFRGARCETISFEKTMGSPRIILLNFTEKETDVVLKAGYAVERGIIGLPDRAEEFLPYQTPHPLYEYDVLVYRSDCPEAVQKELIKPCNLFEETGSERALRKFDTPPIVRVAFVGRAEITNLLPGGLPFVSLTPAEANVSSFVEQRGSTFSIDDLHRLISGFKTKVARVRKFISVPRDTYPLFHIPVLTSRSGEEIASYGTSYDSTAIPRYVILPNLDDVPNAVIALLRCFESVYPALFPGKIGDNWLESDEFLLQEEKAKNREIEEIITKAKELIDGKKAERDELSVHNSFIRRVLVATEDQKLNPEERLSGVVKKSCEFLEFEVVDIDQATKSAIKKEDFWVIDGEFLAITEVTGTVNKNPKIKEFNDILARMATIYRRKSDLKLPEGKTITGLLVLNYDVKNHPSFRPRVYTGDDEHIVETAIEQGIGILSTVELHKILVAVKEGVLAKSAARAILRKPGRIEFDVSSQV
jgi:hypothetical protein